MREGDEKKRSTRSDVGEFQHTEGGNCNFILTNGFIAK
jgi:hypothetical protein